MQIIPFNDDLNELQRHNERKNQTGDWNDYVFGQSVNHSVHTAVPCGGCLTDLIGDVTDFFVDSVEQPGQVVHGAAD